MRADTLPDFDTIRCGEGYELVQKTGSTLNGYYYAFNAGGDTVLTGEYRMGKRTGHWHLTGYTPCMRSAAHPLKDFIWFTEGLFKGANVIVDLEFSNDSTLRIVQYSYSISRSPQLTSRSEITFGRDTLQVDSSWYRNGALSQVVTTTYDRRPTDTAWKWREDGTLHMMALYNKGVQVFCRYYDASGTKVISEE